MNHLLFEDLRDIERLTLLIGKIDNILLFFLLYAPLYEPS